MKKTARRCWGTYTRAWRQTCVWNNPPVHAHGLGPQAMADRAGDTQATNVGDLADSVLRKKEKWEELPASRISPELHGLLMSMLFRQGMNDEDIENFMDGLFMNDQLADSSARVKSASVMLRILSSTDQSSFGNKIKLPHLERQSALLSELAETLNDPMDSTDVHQAIEYLQSTRAVKTSEAIPGISIHEGYQDLPKLLRELGLSYSEEGNRAFRDAMILDGRDVDTEHIEDAEDPLDVQSRRAKSTDGGDDSGEDQVSGGIGSRGGQKRRLSRKKRQGLRRRERSHLGDDADNASRTTVPSDIFPSLPSNAVERYIRGCIKKSAECIFNLMGGDVDTYEREKERDNLDIDMVRDRASIHREQEVGGAENNAGVPRGHTISRHTAKAVMSALAMGRVNADDPEQESSVEMEHQNELFRQEMELIGADPLLANSYRNYREEHSQTGLAIVREVIPSDRNKYPYIRMLYVNEDGNTVVKNAFAVKDTGETTKMARLATEANEYLKKAQYEEFDETFKNIVKRAEDGKDIKSEQRVNSPSSRHVNYETMTTDKVFLQLLKSEIDAMEKEKGQGHLTDEYKWYLTQNPGTSGGIVRVIREGDRERLRIVTLDRMARAKAFHVDMHYQSGVGVTPLANKMSTVERALHQQDMVLYDHVFSEIMNEMNDMDDDMVSDAQVYMYEENSGDHSCWDSVRNSQRGSSGCAEEPQTRNGITDMHYSQDPNNHLTYESFREATTGDNDELEDAVPSNSDRRRFGISKHVYTDKIGNPTETLQTSFISHISNLVSSALYHALVFSATPVVTGQKAARALLSVATERADGGDPSEDAIHAFQENNGSSSLKASFLAETLGSNETCSAFSGFTSVCSDACQEAVRAVESGDLDSSQYPNFMDNKTVITTAVDNATNGLFTAMSEALASLTKCSYSSAVLYLFGTMCLAFLMSCTRGERGNILKFTENYGMLSLLGRAVHMLSTTRKAAWSSLKSIWNVMVSYAFYYTGGHTELEKAVRDPNARAHVEDFLRQQTDFFKGAAKGLRDTVSYTKAVESTIRKFGDAPHVKNAARDILHKVVESSLSIAASCQEGIHDAENDARCSQNALLAVRSITAREGDYEWHELTDYIAGLRNASRQAIIRTVQASSFKGVTVATGRHGMSETAALVDSRLRWHTLPWRTLEESVESLKKGVPVTLFPDVTFTMSRIIARDGEGSVKNLSLPHAIGNILMRVMLDQSQDEYLGVDTTDKCASSRGAGEEERERASENVRNLAKAPVTVSLSEVRRALRRGRGGGHDPRLLDHGDMYDSDAEGGYAVEAESDSGDDDIVGSAGSRHNGFSDGRMGGVFRDPDRELVIRDISRPVKHTFSPSPASLYTVDSPSKEVPVSTIISLHIGEGTGSGESHKDFLTAQVRAEISVMVDGREWYRYLLVVSDVSPGHTFKFFDSETSGSQRGGLLSRVHTSSDEDVPENIDFPVFIEMVSSLFRLFRSIPPARLCNIPIYYAFPVSREDYEMSVSLATRLPSQFRVYGIPESQDRMSSGALRMICTEKGTRLLPTELVSTHDLERTSYVEDITHGTHGNGGPTGGFEREDESAILRTIPGQRLKNHVEENSTRGSALLAEIITSMNVSGVHVFHMRPWRHAGAANTHSQSRSVGEKKDIVHIAIRMSGEEPKDGVLVFGDKRHRACLDAVQIQLHHSARGEDFVICEPYEGNPQMASQTESRDGLWNTHNLWHVSNLLSYFFRVQKVAYYVSDTVHIGNRDEKSTLFEEKSFRSIKEHRKKFIIFKEGLFSEEMGSKESMTTEFTKNGYSIHKASIRDDVLGSTLKGGANGSMFNMLCNEEP